MILATSGLTMKINIDAEAKRRASAGRESENGIFCLRKGLWSAPKHIYKNPAGKSGAGAESPQDTWPGLLGTFVISILLDIFFFYRLKMSLMTALSICQCFQALKILYYSLFAVSYSF